MQLHDLLNDRLIMVTGKGGTGKTTVAAAVARVLAASGRRTLLCEVDAQRPALAPVVGRPLLGLEPVTLEPNFDVCNLLWPDVLATYLESMVRIRRVVNAILGNEMVRRFLDFTPGSQELVELSVVGDMVGRYDVVVVDMPASGHAFSMLDITRSALGVFRAGPVRTRVKQLRELVQDSRTRVVFASLPEEMVVNETMETAARLRESSLLGGDPLVILNRTMTPRFSTQERTLLRRVSDAAESDAAKEWARAGRWELSLELAAEDAISRLSRAMGQMPVVIPPIQGTPAETSHQLAVLLGDALGVTVPEAAWI